MAQIEPTKRRATIYDVADAANVAISTVSRVLNNSEDVSDSTRQRVVDTIRRLNYSPDRTAKSLAQRDISTLAFACPTFITPFHNELLKGVRMGLSEITADLLICDLAWKHPHQTLYDFLRRGRVDGLLLAGVTANDDLIYELKSLHAPVVMIGYEAKGFPSFVWDEIAGSRLATQHLLSRGHEQIGLLLPTIDSPLRQNRLQGYKEALADAGLTFNPALVRTGRTDKHAGFSEESGYEAMNDLLDSRDDITAVFAASDVQAIGALKAARERNLNVPKDMAVLGYDDIKTSAFIGLSSVAQHMYDVGQESAQFIVDQLDNPSPKSFTKHVEAELQIRDTT